MLEAYISHVVTDQGNGGAFCSNCLETISESLQKKWFEETMEAVKHNLAIIEKRKHGEFLAIKANFQYPADHMVCPNCKAHLKHGGISVQSGGSDF